MVRPKDGLPKKWSAHQPNDFANVSSSRIQTPRVDDRLDRRDLVAGTEDGNDEEGVM